MKEARLGDVLIAISVAATILSFVGSLGKDIWLASTQWLLVAATLAIYAIYARISNQ